MSGTRESSTGPLSLKDISLQVVCRDVNNIRSTDVPEHLFDEICFQTSIRSIAPMIAVRMKLERHIELVDIDTIRQEHAYMIIRHVDDTVQLANPAKQVCIVVRNQPTFNSLYIVYPFVNHIDDVDLLEFLQIVSATEVKSWDVRYYDIDVRFTVPFRKRRLHLWYSSESDIETVYRMVDIVNQRVYYSEDDFFTDVHFFSGLLTFENLYWLREEFHN